MRKPNSSVESSMQVIRNLPLYLRASYAREGSTAKDYAMNRCLSHIERINRVQHLEDKKSLLEQAWVVYFELQDFDGSERQDYRPDREVPLHMAKESDIEDEEKMSTGVAFESESPDVFAGGLGYRHVNWDSSFLMAIPKGRRPNPYWQPDKPRNKVGTPEHKAMRSLEESGYWACQPEEPDKWYEKMGCTLVESSNR